MILDEDETPRDTAGLAQEVLSIDRVMEHVNEHANISRRIRKGELPPIEDLCVDPTLWPEPQFDPANGYVWPQPLHQRGDAPVAAADVEYGRGMRNQRRQGFRQNLDTARRHETLVKTTQSRRLRGTVIV
jgi:hypothetical protein